MNKQVVNYFTAQMRLTAPFLCNKNG